MSQTSDTPVLRPARKLYFDKKRTAFAVVAAIALVVIAVVYLKVNLQSLETQNYSQIMSDLALGGRVSQPPPGTKAVLNLCEFDDPYQADAYRWEPITGGDPAPSLEWLRQQVEFIDEQRQAGRPVYVHCVNGINRSGMVAVAYLMRINHWSRDEALAYVQAKRSVVGPNSTYMALLSEWERAIDAGR